MGVLGEGDEVRGVPGPGSVGEELQEELDRDGLEADVTDESNQDVSVLVRFEEGQAQPWSMSGLAKGIIPTPATNTFWLMALDWLSLRHRQRPHSSAEDQPPKCPAP